MSEKINTIYNYLVIADSTVDTATQLTNEGLSFGSNLLTIPLNTVYNSSGITTPAGNIGFVEVLAIRDATQALALPIPNDGTTLKVVDTIEVANQENPIGATKTDYSYDSITASNGMTINGITTFTDPPIKMQLIFLLVHLILLVILLVQELCEQLRVEQLKYMIQII